jgi:nicotinamide-nucleotide amidase
VFVEIMTAEWVIRKYRPLELISVAAEELLCRFVCEHRWMRTEVVAIGTELLLGQIVDTNSSWIGERLAASGLDSHFQTKVGDNHARIVSALRIALGRSDAVICCGGLGPTQDDITREAIAEVMGVPLVRDPAIVAVIAQLFAVRNRVMAKNNERQADVPVGASIIAQTKGTAPGLVCPVSWPTGNGDVVEKVIYAVPGVPFEMMDMMERVIVADLVRRSGEVAVIASRTLRTWGIAESTLAEMVAGRLEALEQPGAPSATIAFLASGMEGIKVRVTAKAPTAAEVTMILNAEEEALRVILGDLVFGVNDQNMEATVGSMLKARGLTLGLAESVTGGLIASRLVAIPGASSWFRGGVVSYASEVKFTVLGVPEGPVVSAEAAMAMAAGARTCLGSSVGLSVTGVAGPDTQDGQPVGTVFVGLALGDSVVAERFSMPGDRERIRQFATINALDMLRKALP